MKLLIKAQYLYCAFLINLIGRKMKKKDRLKIINRVVKEYIDNGYKFNDNAMYPYTVNKIKEWLKDTWLKSYLNNSKIDITLIENQYCCNGLWNRCWFEVIEEGYWGITRKNIVDDVIGLFENNRYYKYKKILNRENRIFIDESNIGKTIVLIVLRDIYSVDYIIDIDWSEV